MVDHLVCVFDGVPDAEISLGHFLGTFEVQRKNAKTATLIQRRPPQGLFFGTFVAIQTDREGIRMDVIGFAIRKLFATDKTFVSVFYGFGLRLRPRTSPDAPCAEGEEKWSSSSSSWSSW